MAADRVLGAVLAGGASSRFGSDKAMAVVDGRSLLEHAQAALARVVEGVVVVGRGAVPDLPRAGLGPLGGIAGALDYAGSHGFASVLTIGCDMPAVPDTLLAALLARMPAFCADAPVLGHWPTALARPLLRYLTTTASDNGKGAGLSVRRWASTVGAVAIPASAPLHNVNTPADLPS